MSDGNLVRLRAVMALFGLTISEVARAASVSRPYVSRLLSEDGKLNGGSSRFYRTLEVNLGKLIDGRGGQVFEVTAIPSDIATGTLASLNKIA